MRIETPLGPLTLVEAQGRLAAIRFDAGEGRASSAPVLAAARSWLQLYFGGDPAPFAGPTFAAGTDFQRAVWTEVARIPFGETRTYAEIAVALGRPGAARAVGAANGANPLPLVIPCHRVVGADGTLTGYAGGLDRKRWLLEHESAQRPLLVPARR